MRGRYVKREANMICKNCGQENPDDFTFCQSCGKRLDGKKICPVCQAKIDEEAKFCGFCGTNLEIASSEIAATQAVTVKEPKTGKRTKVQSIIDLTGTVLVCFAAFAGLLFTFLIGISAAGVSEVNIYQFFGEVYKQYEDIVFDNADVYALIISLMADIAGTAVSAAAIIGAAIFAILTAVEAYKKYAKKQETIKIAKYATATYIWFAVSATLFLALAAMSAKTNGVTARVKFTDATVAGLVLGGIALGGYYCCKIVNNLQEYKHSQSLLSSVIASVVAVLAIVVTALVASPVVSYSSSSSYASGKASSGYFLLSEMLYDPYMEDAQAIKLIICSLVGYLSQAVIAIMAVIVLIKSANAACGAGKAYKLPVFAVVCVVFTVANLVCAVILGNMLKEANPVYTLGYGAPIALLVIGVLALAGSITYKAFGTKNHTEEVKS